MRLTEFQYLVEGQFGQVRGASLLVDHVLSGLGGRTAAQTAQNINLVQSARAQTLAGEPAGSVSRSPADSAWTA